MGLDICVRKILKEPENEYDYFSLTDDYGNYNREGFPEWTKSFENETIEDWYDWDKYKEKTGIDINQYEFHAASYDDSESFIELWPKNAGKYPNFSDFKDWEKYHEFINKHIIKIYLNEIPIYQQKVKILYYKQVGYQRKGFNNKFYEDYDSGKIGYFVWSKSELEKYKQDYCIDEEIKEHFQKYVIDTFIDGETCCIFSW